MNKKIIKIINIISVIIVIILLPFCVYITPPMISYFYKQISNHGYADVATCVDNDGSYPDNNPCVENTSNK